jgi:hypothetical protein
LLLKVTSFHLLI